MERLKRRSPPQRVEMDTERVFRLSILLLALAIVPPALGFDYPLSPEAIREAYFLGAGNYATSGPV
jgi:hypothetical protein